MHLLALPCLPHAGPIIRRMLAGTRREWPPLPIPPGSKPDINGSQSTINIWQLLECCSLWLMVVTSPVTSRACQIQWSLYAIWHYYANANDKHARLGLCLALTGPRAVIITNKNLISSSVGWQQALQWLPGCHRHTVRVTLVPTRSSGVETERQVLSCRNGFPALFLICSGAGGAG